MKRGLLLCLSLLSALPFVRAQDAVNPDNVARFLAGLTVRGTELEAASRNPAWADHAIAFDDAWKKLETRQLSKIRAWTGTFIPEAAASRDPVFYFFSGPDILYAQAFYPSAATYILCGLEPVGVLPNPAAMPPEALGYSLNTLRRSLNAVLSWSFFITKDMKTDLTQTQFQGTLPVMLVFLARAGCRINAVEFVSLDKSGSVISGKGTPGVKILFTGAGGAPQTVYYFQSNLNDGGISSNPGFIRFCESQGRGHSLLKAASYLIHEGGFTKARDFLLANCNMIIQDDSGIPVRSFDPARWQLRFFGTYLGPIELFKQHYQTGLAQAYQSSNPPPLPFGFGYRWQPKQSTVIVATPK